MFSKRFSKIFWSSFIFALLVHICLGFVFHYSVSQNNSLSQLHQRAALVDRSIKLEEINFINKGPAIKKVGIKDGVKNANRPDIVTPPKKPKLSLDNLAAEKIILDESKKEPNRNSKIGEQKSTPPSALSQKLQKEMIRSNDQTGASHFYYSPKKDGVITRNREQEVIKTQASKESQNYVNPAMSRISNFEIRYDRPEGVSEDELNSDEKAYYSFYVRSYKNYFTKIYANYDKVLLSRPGLARAFNTSHLLIGKIDYDKNGEIVKVKIIKSSENDDLHYFFEETLKQLAQPNPPKVFIKNKDSFSIYYQLQIN